MEKLKIGLPLKPMLVSESGIGDERYTDIIRNHGDLTLAEIKSDGYRIQVHKSSDIQLFTRNLNPLDPRLFPELEPLLTELPPGIYDGELVGIEDGINGFNSVKRRITAELNPENVDNYPLEVRFFDVMYLEDKPLVDFPLYKRRDILECCTGNISQQEAIEDSEELAAKFIDVTNAGLEGLVCKNPESAYLIGRKTKDWVKLKGLINLDLAVLGVYQGQGKASRLPFAGLLLGTRNNGQYETITKVGISNKDTIQKIYETIGDHLVESIPGNLVLSDRINLKTYRRKVPFRYISPEDSVVIEVDALNVTRSKNWHSCGLEDSFAYSLRIPSVKRIREDKTVLDCTTTQQVSELYSEGA
jgi:DNA ligase 1